MVDINDYLPSTDKLKHFFVWSIYLVIFSLFMTDVLAYLSTLSVAISWELFQKYVKKGTNSKKEMALDIFYGGVLPPLLHIVTVTF